MLVIDYHKNWLEQSTSADLYDIVTSDDGENWAKTSVYCPKHKTRILDVSYKDPLRHKLSFHVNKGGLVLLTQEDSTLHYFLPGAEFESEQLRVSFPAQVVQACSPSALIESPSHTPQTVTDQAMILAAGYATRLEPISGVISGYCKPALPIVGNTSVIEYICNHLASFGIKKFIINVCFLSEAVIDALSHLSKELDVIIINEEEASGTAGGLLKAFESGHVDRSKPILVAQGDGILNFDIGKLLNEHQSHDADVTIGAYTVPDEDVHRFGIITIDESQSKADSESVLIKGFKEKPKLEDAGPSRLANTGLYVLSEKCFDSFVSTGQKIRAAGKLYDFAEDYFATVLSTKQKFLAVPLKGHWSDIGSPASYYEALTLLDTQKKQHHYVLSLVRRNS